MTTYYQRSKLHDRVGCRIGAPPFPVEPGYVEDLVAAGRSGGICRASKIDRGRERACQTVLHSPRGDYSLWWWNGFGGGQLAETGAVSLILSLKDDKNSRRFPEENVMIVDAGAILADIQHAAEDVDRLFPLSLASEAVHALAVSCHECGGVNVLRYGNTRDLCLPRSCRG